MASWWPPGKGGPCNGQSTYKVLIWRRNDVDELVGTEVQLSGRRVFFGVGGEAPFALGLLYGVLDILRLCHVGDGFWKERGGT